MKQIFRTISILAVVACFSSSVALSSGQEQGDAGSATSNVPTTPFEYPMAPDSLPTLGKDIVCNDAFLGCCRHE